MKEFCLKHPVITFFLAGSVLNLANNVLRVILGCKTLKAVDALGVEVTAEEDEDDEPSGDIQ